MEANVAEQHADDDQYGHDVKYSFFGKLMHHACFLLIRTIMPATQQMSAGTVASSTVM